MQEKLKLEVSLRKRVIKKHLDRFLVLIKRLITDPPIIDHRPTNPRSTYHLHTDLPTGYFLLTWPNCKYVLHSIILENFTCNLMWFDKNIWFFHSFRSSFFYRGCLPWLIWTTQSDFMKKTWQKVRKRCIKEGCTLYCSAAFLADILNF